LERRRDLEVGEWNGCVGNQEGLERMRFFEVVKAKNEDMPMRAVVPGIGSEVERGR